MFQTCVERFGHRAITPSKYTASAFIARTLGDLSRTGRPESWILQVPCPHLDHSISEQCP